LAASGICERLAPNDRKETPMTGRVWLVCMIGAALAAAALAASTQATASPGTGAQAPAPPTKAQALTVAGEVAAGWAGALDAAAVDIEPCELAGLVRRCEVHVFDFESDESFDCHWWVRVRVASGDTLAWRTIRRRSDDSDCPSPLPAGPATSGQETVPPAGRLGPAPA
jgi:hypothetical protein